MTSKLHPTRDPKATNAEVAEMLTRYLTFSIEEVADWHFTDVALHREWDKPLGRVLRFLVGDVDLVSPLPSDCAEDEGDAAPLLDITDAPVDVRDDPTDPDCIPAIAA